MPRRHLSLACLATACALSACGGGAHHRQLPPPPVRTRAPTARSAAATRPNIVFVLTDDLSSNLDAYMPHVLRMQREGTSFTNYFVTDSLCCPSRSSIISGRFPHDTGVYTNAGTDGGFHAFHDNGGESQTFATALHAAGYTTAMMGKYLNGYRPRATLGGAEPYVPPGWDEWDVAGNGYPEFGYSLNQDGRVVDYGHSPADYLTDVIASRGRAFIDQAASAHRPFMLELATFAPHAPYVPAPRDAQLFPGLQAPRSPAFDAAALNGPAWLRAFSPLRPHQIAKIDDAFRLRAQSVQAVDRMIASVEAELDGARHRTRHLHRLQLRQRAAHG